ncbi:uncharacterized protein LOC127282703 [Leptopilina boulardi]|uniref:uncharacterized protein LOC127282703 n=1 Tax=Leptopilina boulardi TaxID=63433 RepID=UPI0021F5677C|nr:uncharacterized protein LOC127282703 [Leptopilina boulardi]
MAKNSRQLLKVITEQLNKSALLNNASTVLGKTSEKAQEKLTNIQNVASEKYGNIVKHVNVTGTTIIQDLHAESLKPSTPIPVRLINWWKWYQQLTGLDTVEVSKQHVIQVQDSLFKCQEERRNLNRQSSLVHDKLKEVYAELIQTKRDDPKYVQLTIMENKGLQEESRIRNQLNLLENEERDHFTQLATAIKEYHDSQTMNAQKYKYLSILASAFLAILSLTGSMIYNNRRIVDVRNVISEAQKKNENNFRDNFQTLEQSSRQQFSNIIQLINSKTNFTPAENKISDISNENTSLMNTNLAVNNKHIAFFLTGLLIINFILVRSLT